MRIASFAAAVALSTSPAVTGELGKNSDRAEARIGGGVYGVRLLGKSSPRAAVINGELLLPAPGWLDVIGSPRPYVGLDAGLHPDAVHFLYAGLNWDYHLTQRLYLSASLGGAVHTADTLSHLGSRALFHVGAAAGYDFTPDLTGQVYFNHFSNAYLASANGGHDSAGVRLGYRF